MTSQSSTPAPKKSRKKKTAETNDTFINVVDITNQFEERFDKDHTVTPYSFGAWSFSKISQLERCPFKFFLDYVIKVKLPDPPLNDSTARTIIGKGAHEILEIHVRDKVSMSEAYDRVHVEYFPQLTDKYWKNLVSLRDNLEKFSYRIEMFCIQNNVEQVLTERELAVTKDWTPTEFFAEDAWFRGYADLSFILPNKDNVTIDHKYGGSRFAFKNHTTQLDLYGVMQPIEGNYTPGIHFMEEGEIVLGEPKSQEYLRNVVISNVDASIRWAVDYVKEQKFFPAVESSKCKYCIYEPLCKAGKLQHLIDKTRDLEAFKVT